MCNLHSTMYLLNPNTHDKNIPSRTTFTFHYVSIKSNLIVTPTYCLQDLHSTMYLLNHVTNFHICRNFQYLHSTMYLLNPVDVALMTM